MKQRLLFLLFFIAIIFFGSCTKDCLSDTELPRGSDIVNTKGVVSSSCGYYGECENCGLCLRPDCYFCGLVCECSPCASARCPLCRLCVVGRTYSSNRNAESCLTCSCNFTPQQEELGCFLTAMQYVSQLTGRDLTMEYIRGLFVPKDEPFDGVTADQVSSMMDAVFGDDYCEIQLPSYSSPNDCMKDLLDRDYLLITNYPVNTEHGMYAHAVVVTGYVNMGNYVIYTCLDPGMGQYYFKDEEDLNWNSPNKFMVSVSKYY